MEGGITKKSFGEIEKGQKKMRNLKDDNEKVNGQSWRAFSCTYFANDCTSITHIPLRETKKPT